MKKKVENSSFNAKDVRWLIIDQAKRSQTGHIGSALCVADILVILYTDILDITDSNNPDRDRFVLSKGHAALALYAVFFLKGWINRQEFESYCCDNSMLGVHPEHTLTGIDFSTGSLGQGLSIAAGSALALRLKKSDKRVFALISDGECNEGVIWEAAMFAAQQKLSNLIVIVDVNSQQAFGYTKDVLDLEPIQDIWKAFGWDTHEVDGHNISQISQVIKGLKANAPHVLIARTVFGKGVSFMENKIKWHYWPMSEQEHKQAVKEIGEQK